MLHRIWQNGLIMTDKDHIYDNNKEWYGNMCWNPVRGYCGIRRMMFTVGLFYGIDVWAAEGRYCFETMAEAVDALKEWDGRDDAPGDWIKHFGKEVYSHPDSTDPFAIKRRLRNEKERDAFAD